MDLIEECDKCKLSECINCEHSWADIQEIKKQLAEKDKEIANIRHQVCEEIREKFSHWGYIGNPEMLSKRKCLEILDQIEGENDERL